MKADTSMLLSDILSDKPANLANSAKRQLLHQELTMLKMSSSSAHCQDELGDREQKFAGRMTVVQVSNVRSESVSFSSI